jgi:peptidoglycan-N-acetylglucosamine deacetylase
VLKNVVLKVFKRMLPSRLFLLRRKSREPALFLTFDDGPHPTVTPKLLDVLDQYGVKASFFVIGSNIEQYPDIAADIVRKGHTLANHSYSHPNFSKITMSERVEQISKTDTLIEQITGKKCTYFRAPQGRWHVPTLLYLMRKRITAAHWSRDSLDYQKKECEVIVSSFSEQPVSNGEVILFHDDNILSTQVLTELIPRWQEQGFTLKSLEM